MKNIKKGDASKQINQILKDNNLDNVSINQKLNFLKNNYQNIVNQILGQCELGEDYDLLNTVDIRDCEINNKLGPGVEFSLFCHNQERNKLDSIHRSSSYIISNNKSEILIDEEKKYIKNQHVKMGNDYFDTIKEVLDFTKTSFDVQPIIKYLISNNYESQFVKFFDLKLKKNSEDYDIKNGEFINLQNLINVIFDKYKKQGIIDLEEFLLLKYYDFKMGYSDKRTKQIEKNINKIVGDFWILENKMKF